MPDPNSLYYIQENGQQLNITATELIVLVQDGLIYYCPECRSYHIAHEIQTPTNNEGWDVIDAAIERITRPN